MTLFATELQLNPDFTPAAFLASVFAWIRGIKDSQVLDNATEQDLSGDSPKLGTAAGELLSFVRLGGVTEWTAVGFRHDIPDKAGRLWRTEGVLRRTHDYPLLRVRGQCLATKDLAPLQPPRRPHLLRSLIGDIRVSDDLMLSVKDEPHFLAVGDSGQLTANAIIQGTATQFLPIIYVSARGGGGDWLIPRERLAALARELAGVAHVVVEPNRAFSFALRDLCGGKNVYGGTLGLAIPGRGFVRQFFLGPEILDSVSLYDEVSGTALDLRTDMATRGGWDWLELQEASIREQRERDKQRLSTEETEKLYLDELETKDERIRELETQLAFVKDRQQVSTETQPTWAGGPELYPGEHEDRIRAVLTDFRGRALDAGWDRRTLHVVSAILDRLAPSAGLLELREDLKRATKDSKKGAKQISDLLVRHGYITKSENKHIRLEALEDYPGLDTITISKTPSDHRAPENMRKQVEDALGLKKL